MTNFIENFIFENEKDTPIHNSIEFKKILKDKYNLKYIPDLYKKLVNYQISKYGESLANSSLVETRSRDDCIRKGINARKRKYYRKRK